MLGVELPSFRIDIVENTPEQKLCSVIPQGFLEVRTPALHGHFPETGEGNRGCLHEMIDAPVYLPERPLQMINYGGFHSVCPRAGEHFPVLGCIRSNTAGVRFVEFLV